MKELEKVYPKIFKAVSIHGFKAVMKQIEFEILKEQIRKSGSQIMIAKKLNIPRTTFLNKVKRFKLKLKEGIEK